MFGFNQVTWDNDSGQEPQPPSFNNYWNELTENEKAAAVLLGFTQRSWDNHSGLELQPASLRKTWAGLTACPKSDDAPHARFIRISFFGAVTVAVFVGKSGRLNASSLVFVCAYGRTLTRLIIVLA